ncbi:hypothetical protein PFISCL1PPCAC_1808 [Pristionchus fissidentatus]|uniref:Uncharacterized protein n=1 Tax=Pristionchus fissidentatus TaxID=1538716 RepID=A0AAV5UTU2_9BILA|nr:hypothetical protein PFISCL1PPCAC_1808 [Pristionchus fissidentatus]
MHRTRGFLEQGLWREHSSISTQVMPLPEKNRGHPEHLNVPGRFTHSIPGWHGLLAHSLISTHVGFVDSWITR